MAWLARLDTRATRWPTPARRAFVSLKWALVALGAWCWVGVWFQRDVWLGVLQLGFMAWVIYAERSASHSASPK